MPTGVYERSNEAKVKLSKGLGKGKNHPNWKGDNAGYLAIHKWLRTNYGKANKCEFDECFKISLFFEWGLIKGKKYERKRENFMQMCRSCHHRYDMTDNLREKLRAVTRGQFGRFIKV